MALQKVALNDVRILLREYIRNDSRLGEILSTYVSTGQLLTVAEQGTSPFIVSSTTVTPNLNADLLDGHHASEFVLESELSESLVLEAIDDRVAALLQNGSGLTWTYNDAAGTLTPAVDHGGLAGLSDDDHTQYVLASGTRNITGDITLEQDVFVQGSGVIGHGSSADLRVTRDVYATKFYGDGSSLTGIVTDHGSTTGLADDDHTQYLLLAGRGTGGQSVAEPLTISSTTQSFLLKLGHASGSFDGSVIQFMGGAAGTTTRGYIGAQVGGGGGSVLYSGVLQASAMLIRADNGFEMGNSTTRYFVMDTAGAFTIGSEALPSARLHIRNSTSTTTPHVRLEQLDSGDAAMQFTISGDAFALGIDNSDNDAFKLSYAASTGGAALGTSDFIKVTTTGHTIFGNLNIASLLENYWGSNYTKVVLSNVGTNSAPIWEMWGNRSDGSAAHVGAFTFNNSASSDTTLDRMVASIEVLSDIDNVSSNLGVLRFTTHDASTSLTSRLALWYDGKIGMGAAATGTTNATGPQTDLHIQEATTDTTPTVEVENTSSGDAGIQFSAGAAGFAVGVDNSDSDKFKISYGNGLGTAALGTNDLLSIDASATGDVTVHNDLFVGASGVFDDDIRSTTGDVYARDFYGSGGIRLGGALRENVVTLTDGATPALDASLGNVFVLVAAGNRTIAVPSNATSGQKIVIRHTASGADRTLSLNTGAGGFRFGTDITALTATTSAKTDYIGCIYNGTDSKWDVVAYVKGY